MDYQAVFKRTEIKYILEKDQFKSIMDAAKGRMEEDEYARSTIRSIYYDTSNFILARRSIEKPVYKEKLRLRSYRPAGESDTVFLEIKKKYDGIVYKRRTDIRYSDAVSWIDAPSLGRPETQIDREIDYFIKCYGSLLPQMLICYDRLAMKGIDDPSFRMTFDTNVCARTEDVNLGSDTSGNPLIDRDMTLMELKSAGGIPVWLTDVLSEDRIYPTSFSKYGTAYRNLALGMQDMT